MASLTGGLLEYEFVLVLAGVELSDEVANALFEAGCDDATPSLKLGRLYLWFNREAANLKTAILSAIRQVMAAGIGAEVVGVDECNLVSPSDIARRLGRSRQLVGQYVNGQRGPGNFPAPVADLVEGQPLWQWCEVAEWLFTNQLVSADVLEHSRVIAAINSACEYLHQRKHDAALQEEVIRICGQSA